MTLPGWLAAVLAAETATTWEAIAPLVPPSCYLAGGTAIAVHIRHRESRDLDFLYHRDGVDLDALERTLTDTDRFAVTSRAPGTLNGLFSATRVQFLHADQERPQYVLEEPKLVEGLRVASLPDLVAMKLKVLAQRGEQRDYFDLERIEEETGLTVDTGISYFIARYEPADPDAQVSAIVRALGYMDDVDEDEQLPLSKAQVATYWQRRQPEVLKNLGWLTDGGTAPPPTPRR